MRMTYTMIPVIACILIFALVAGKLGYPVVGKILVYFGIFMTLINFIYTASWVVRKNSGVYKLWKRGHKLDEAVY